MNIYKNSIVAVIFAAMYVLGTTVGYANDYTVEVGKASDYLKTQQSSDGSIFGFAGTTAWALLAFVAEGETPHTITNNNNSLVTFLTQNQPTAASSPTEWSRELLAVVAAGENPYSFNDVNYIEGLLQHFDGTQLGEQHYVNDDIFGLLAFLTVNDPSLTDTKEHILSAILVNQEADGGFGWSIDSGSDIDTTAAAIQALVVANQRGISHQELNTALEAAKNYLLSAQNLDGGFPYVPFDLSNTSSTAWAAMAVKALGNLDTAYNNALQFITTSQHSDGSFCWMGCDFGGDTFTTAYAIMALSHATWPIGTYSGRIPSPTPTAMPTVTAMPTPSALPTPTGIVLAEVVELPQTGTGFGFLQLTIVFVVLGIGTNMMLRVSKYI